MTVATSDRTSVSVEPALSAALSLGPWSRRLLRGLPPLLLAVFFVPTFFVASVMPYRYWDSLAFGAWSRLIGEYGHIDFGDRILSTNLNRPLFYVGQGLLWLAFGHHEWLGRWLSALFSFAFAVGVYFLASQLTRDSAGRTVARALAVAIVLASSLLAEDAASGMSDVPVAATAAVTAALLWSRSLGPARLPLVALFAAATVLAKPTGLLALLGIVLASLVLAGERGERRPIGQGLAALAAGVAGALAYDLVMADKRGESLADFLRAGNTQYYLERAGRERWDALLRAEWLGAGMRLALVYGLVYGVVRAFGGRGRAAAALAAPAALLWSLAGPVLADGGTPYPFTEGLSLDLVAWLALAATIVAAPFVPQPHVVDRRVFAALLLWALPGAVAWAVYRPDQARFLSPSWPALALLAAAALAPAALGATRLRPAAAFVPVAAASLLVVGNVVNVDGLGRDGWRDLLDLGPSGWSDRAEIENFAYGPMSYELNAARANLGPHEQLISNDARLTYFFPGRVLVAYPNSCAELKGYRVLVLLTGGESAEIMTRIYRSSADPLAWLQCASPPLHQVNEQPGINATFVVGAPPKAPGAPADCGVRTAPGQMFDAVFADGVSYAKAEEIRARAAGAGFQFLRIERTACDSFRIVVPGVRSLKDDIRREAASVGFRIAIVPAVRYPEVPPDVPAMRP